MPQISIIVPVYNSSGYLNKCIQSILQQTYADYELILVDDGSTDDSGLICDTYAADHKNIKVIHKANSGPSDARNEGIAAASGMWILFVDSDDILSAETLEKVSDVFSPELDLVVFDHVTISDGKIPPVEKSGMPSERYALSSEQERFDFITGKVLRHKIGWEVWGKAFRRSRIEQYGVTFQPGEFFAEDQLFFVCYMAHVSSLLYIHEKLYGYRIRANSIMDNYRKKDNLATVSRLGEAGWIYFKGMSDCKLIYDAYSVIYYLMLLNEIRILERVCDMTRREIRPMILENIENFQFFCSQLKALRKQRTALYRVFGGMEAEHFLSDAQYYLDGHWFMSRVRNRLIQWCKTLIEKEIR